MTVPDWAEVLAVKVCKDYRRYPPGMRWAARGTYSSSGVTYMLPRYRYKTTVKKDRFGDTHYTTKRIRGSKHQILIRAGSEDKDTRLVLLHELAHYILGKSKKGRREHHSMRFWRLAFELYERYGVDLKYAYDREKHYKEKASWAYAEIAKEPKS